MQKKKNTVTPYRNIDLIYLYLFVCCFYYFYCLFDIFASLRAHATKPHTYTDTNNKPPERAAVCFRLEGQSNVEKKRKKQNKPTNCCSFALIKTYFCSFIGILCSVSYTHNKSQQSSNFVNNREIQKKN